MEWLNTIPLRAIASLNPEGPGGGDCDVPLRLKAGAVAESLAHLGKDRMVS